MDGRVDHECGAIDRSRPIDHVAVVIDQQQVADPYVAEAHPERVDPEVVGEFGIPDGDVTGHTFAEPDPSEDPQRAGQLLLAMKALVLNSRERRRAVEADRLRRQLDAVDRSHARFSSRHTPTIRRRIPGPAGGTARRSVRRRVAP